MKFLNIMITPKGDCITEIDDTPYFHSVFFSLEQIEGPEINMKLPNGDYLHSKLTGKGEFLLIERKVNV
jgi:hypothetical protein